MKKFCIMFFALCIIAISLVSCTNEPITSKNQIAPKKMTQDQEDIVNLLSSDKQEILLFDYKTEEAYKSMEFWVEIYENGVLIDRPSGVNSFSDEAKPLNGQLAILITQNSGFQWTFTVSENSGRISHTSEAINADYDTIGRAFGPIDEPITIENDKEIVIYTSIFSNGGISTYSVQQIYIEQPELIKEYPYVHIIKCKFTK